ncbi:uncharacterized protein LOC122289292 [Carya illinoinensis]|uniref:uncharacterized protein LOC122289292 n=1 Tax=Carya illinoinensis TaxID=32201 RepID=UPI001C71A48C|nr:uncharacterized protein LOC122289292 [Carya illinoinensis]
MGGRGGLALLWKEEGEVEIVNYSQHHISAYVGKEDRWLLTGFYGHSEVNKRRDTWNLLSLIKPSDQVPWCTIGDFNEVCCQDEKEGGRPRPESQMREFWHALDENCLFDLGWKGCKFTWSNKHEDQTFTKERLDRAVANWRWIEMFKNREVEVLTASQSDHKALLLSMDKGVVLHMKRRRLFRFEAKWTLKEDGGAVIEDVWKRRKRQDAEKQIKEKTERLKVEQEEEGPHNVKIIKSLQRELGLLLAQEDIKWKQRAKRNWYKNGDKNTKFFHSCANQRRIKNRIKEIKDANGQLVNEQGEMERVLSMYFQNLFASTNPTMEAIDECLRGIRPRVTLVMNEDLQRPYVEEEIRIALKQMASLKSPRPDGYEACFYHAYWETIGEEVSTAVLGFLNGEGGLGNGLNYTYIALIPKVKDPLLASEFRLISLCNVMYKLISKVLANRLKKVLPLLISHKQSAFIPERLITDKVMIAYEALHSMKTRQKGKVGSMTLKLDMAKVYDRIEWRFVESIMRKMGFEERWIGLIMQCVSSVTYLVLVNG